MPCPGGYEDSIPWRDFPALTVYFHRGLPLQDKIELLAFPVIVPLGRPVRRQTGLGKALFFHRRVGGVKDTADGGTIRCGKGTWLARELTVMVLFSYSLGGIFKFALQAGPDRLVNGAWQRITIVAIFTLWAFAGQRWALLPPP